MAKALRLAEARHVNGKGPPKTGRPLRIATPEEFEERATAFFDHCEADGEPITISGLCLALGLRSRQSLIDYEAREGFEDVVRWAKLKVEESWEKRLWTSKNATPSIFCLKANAGWREYSPASVEERSTIIFHFNLGAGAKMLDAEAEEIAHERDEG